MNEGQINLARAEIVVIHEGEPKVKKKKLDKKASSTTNTAPVNKTPPFYRDWGLKLAYNLGTVYLSSTDSGHQKTMTNSDPNTSEEQVAQLAEGQASLNGYSISLTSRSKYGWQLSPNFGFSSIKSTLKDDVSHPNDPSELAGRVVLTSCEWADGSNSSSCADANMYEIDTQIIFVGIWAGYISTPRPLSWFKTLNHSFKVGVEWNPLSFIWAKTSLNHFNMSDEIYFTFRGSLLFHLEYLAEFENSGWFFSLATQLGHLATLSYGQPLEFRGPNYCNEGGCSRYRSYTDETLLLMTSLQMALIKLW